MEELKTKLGTDIPSSTRGILYLCEYNKEVPSIKVIREGLFTSAGQALECYANIPNPESQLVTGKDFNTLIKNLIELHNQMENQDWLISLKDYL